MSEQQPLYTARVDNVDGTSGTVRIHGAQEPVLATGGPEEGAEGFNPEQFLAMAWSTCLGETLRVIMAAQGLEHRSRVRVEVDLLRDPAGGFRFAPRALISIEDLDPERARRLVAAAHGRCPVSKLLRGQGDPIVELVTPAST